MANLGCLLVCTFGNFFAPVLVATHRVNNLDFGNEQGLENEGYESNLKNLFSEYFVSVAQTKKELSPAWHFYVVTITTPSSRGLSKMIEFFKNAFWYIIQKISNY